MADEFRLVDTVLMAAAKTAAINNPVNPGGKMLGDEMGKHAIADVLVAQARRLLGPRCC